MSEDRAVSVPLVFDGSIIGRAKVSSKGEITIKVDNRSRHIVTLFEALFVNDLADHMTIGLNLIPATRSEVGEVSENKNIEPSLIEDDVTENNTESKE